jgi:hypothetical protein
VKANSVGALLCCALLAGCLCNPEVPEVSAKDTRPGAVDSKPATQLDKGTATAADADRGVAEASVDTHAFVLDVTCPDGSKPDLASMPNCKTLIDRVLKECCPKPNNAVNESFAAMVCVANADGLCKMVLDNTTSFQMTCDSMKADKGCT